MFDISEVRRERACSSSPIETAHVYGAIRPWVFFAVVSRMGSVSIHVALVNARAI